MNGLRSIKAREAAQVFNSLKAGRIDSGIAKAALVDLGWDRGKATAEVNKAVQEA
jgi:hypothetical protein